MTRAYDLTERGLLMEGAAPLVAPWRDARPACGAMQLEPAEAVSRRPVP
jgi:hypothetical protein